MEARLRNGNIVTVKVLRTKWRWTLVSYSRREIDTDTGKVILSNIATQWVNNKKIFGGRGK